MVYNKRILEDNTLLGSTVKTFEQSLCEKWPNTDFFSGSYFPVFELNTDMPIVGKYGPAKTLLLDTFY